MLPLWAEDEKTLQKHAYSQLDDHTRSFWRILGHHRSYDLRNENHVAQLKRVVQSNIANQERVMREKKLEGRRKLWIEEEEHQKKISAIKEELEMFVTAKRRDAELREAQQIRKQMRQDQLKREQDQNAVPRCQHLGRELLLDEQNSEGRNDNSRNNTQGFKQKQGIGAERGQALKTQSNPLQEACQDSAEGLQGPSDLAACHSTGSNDLGRVGLIERISTQARELAELLVIQQLKMCESKLMKGARLDQIPAIAPPSYEKSITNGIEEL